MKKKTTPAKKKTSIVKAKPETAKKVTAAQIEKGELESLGKRIMAHLEKVRTYEAKAHEKAGVELHKADDNWNSFTQLLAEAKAQCDTGGFKAFKRKYCPNRQKSRIYELLAIGSGKKTLEETRAEKRARVAKSRQKKKVSATTPHVADNKKPVVPDGLRRVPGAESLPELPRDIATLTRDEDPAASAERRKIAYAKIVEAEAVPEKPVYVKTVEPPVLAPTEQAVIDGLNQGTTGDAAPEDGPANDPLFTCEKSDYPTLYPPSPKATPWLAAQLKPIFDGTIKNDEAKSASALVQLKLGCAYLLPLMTPKDLEEVANLGQVVWDQKIAVEDAVEDTKRTAAEAKRIAWEAKHPEKAKEKALKQAQDEAMECDLEVLKKDAKEDGARWSDVKDEKIAEWLADNWNGEEAEAEFEKEFAEKWTREHGSNFPHHVDAPVKQAPAEQPAEQVPTERTKTATAPAVNEGSTAKAAVAEQTTEARPAGEPATSVTRPSTWRAEDLVANPMGRVGIGVVVTGGKYAESSRSTKTESN